MSLFHQYSFDGHTINNLNVFSHSRPFHVVSVIQGIHTDDALQIWNEPDKEKEKTSTGLLIESS